ncbi:hypothetical protein B0H14DRAFT_3127722 [Mycena olivaceomarginata]|nr:hypothetical protein B0H14DRAFT_3127722 [Mycena olivaceomarginata]
MTAVAVQVTDKLIEVKMICVSTILLAVVVNILSAPAAAAAAAGTTGPISPLAAPFGINFGTQGNNDVAWVDGQSQGNNVIIGPNGPNPCGQAFSLNGLSGLTFEGCGGPGLSINHNGALFEGTWQ